MKDALYQDERIDEVNDGLRLIQKEKGFTFGTDALLLAAYLSTSPRANAVELGCGSGIVSLLAAKRGKAGHITAYEVQETYASLALRNVALNGLEETITVLHDDIRNCGKKQSAEKADVVFSNPPYMVSSGVVCQDGEKQAARHEVFGGIDDFSSAAARLLKYGGSYFVVYRPDRLTDLLVSLRGNKLEPKRITFVYGKESLPPSVVLVEAKKGGRAASIVTRPLIISNRDGSYSEEMNVILQTGRFPSAWKKNNSYDK